MIYLDKKKILKLKYYFSLFSTLTIIIFLTISLLNISLYEVPPKKKLSQEEYAIAVPFYQENNKYMINSYNEVNTSIALFGINISYEFHNIKIKNRVFYSQNISTSYEFWIKEPYQKIIEIYDRVTVIVVKSIGTNYLTYLSDYYGQPLLEYLQNEKILIYGYFNSSTINFINYISIFVNNSGWYTNIFDNDIGIEIISLNETEIQKEKDIYQEKIYQYEKNKAERYQFIGLVISFIAIIMLFLTFFDNWAEVKGNIKQEGEKPKKIDKEEKNINKDNDKKSS